MKIFGGFTDLLIMLLCILVADNLTTYSGLLEGITESNPFIHIISRHPLFIPIMMPAVFYFLSKLKDSWVGYSDRSKVVLWIVCLSFWAIPINNLIRLVWR